jgi:DNA-binding GntR family transcriptional regulator
VRGLVADNKITNTEKIYQLIKSQIIAMKLKPGESLTEIQIAGEMGISKTPVREAFHRLEIEGFLYHEAFQKWKVSTLSIKDIDEIFDIKTGLEGMISRKASLCQDKSLKQELVKTVHQMKEARDKDDVNQFTTMDDKFHEIVFTMAGNDRGYRIFQNINEQWRRIWIGFIAVMSRGHRSIGEHELIAEAIISGNGEEAERLTILHINSLRADVIKLLESLAPFTNDRF